MYHSTIRQSLIFMHTIFIVHVRTFLESDLLHAQLQQLGKEHSNSESSQSTDTWSHGAGPLLWQGRGLAQVERRRNILPHMCWSVCTQRLVRVHVRVYKCSLINVCMYMYCCTFTRTCTCVHAHKRWGKVKP